jgi:hypothetical protein
LSRAIRAGIVLCMKKQIRVFKLASLAVAIAGFGIGCASSGYAHYDRDHSKTVGASASMETGTASATVSDMDVARARSTVSALSFVPDTRPKWVNKFPLEWNERVVEVYTFRVPEKGLNVATTTETAPTYTADMTPGSVFVEAAGGKGEVRPVRVIQHSPNPH